jgi:hypothetical protein
MTEEEGSKTPEPTRRLRPSTVEAIKEDPKMAPRGFEYSDIDEMTVDQADAMSYSLAKSIRSFKKDAGRARARGVGFLKDETNGDDAEQYEIKARLYTAALKDLCGAFGLETPV